MRTSLIGCRSGDGGGKGGENIKEESVAILAQEPFLARVGWCAGGPRAPHKRSLVNPLGIGLRHGVMSVQRDEQVHQGECDL